VYRETGSGRESETVALVASPLGEVESAVQRTDWAGVEDFEERAMGAAETLDEKLQQAVATAIESPGTPARDPVNQPMIRHWCDAIGDDNPIYTDPELAAQSIQGEIVAPPTMLQAWNMAGVRPRRPAAAGSAGPDPLQLLDEAGYTSVVATNCEQKYFRYLKQGDLLYLSTRLESVTGPKKTGLGEGYFVTTLQLYRDQAGETVGEMRFRLLKFKPPTAS
jgi:hypothetical protein